MSLGTTKWETAMRVVLPAARVGIFGACVLGARTRVGRDDRRDDGDRKPAGDLGVALCAVVHARERDRERVHRSDDEHLHQRADRAGLDSVLGQHRRQRARAAHDLERARVARRSRVGTSSEAIPERGSARDTGA